MWSHLIIARVLVMIPLLLFLLLIGMQRILSCFPMMTLVWGPLLFLMLREFLLLPIVWYLSLRVVMWTSPILWTLGPLDVSTLFFFFLMCGRTKLSLDQSLLSLWYFLVIDWTLILFVIGHPIVGLVQIYWVLMLCWIDSFKELFSYYFGRSLIS